LHQARCAQQQGDVQQAAHCYRAVLQHHPGHAEALHGLGVLVCQAGDLAGAAVLIRRAIAQQGKVPSYHYNLGNVLMRQGDYPGAAAAYETALRLDPHFPEAYHNLGVVRQEQGQLEAAAVAYQAVLRLRPDNVAAYNNLGTVLRERGELAAAAEIYSTVLRLQPDCAEAHNNLGLVRQEQYDFRAARAAYETALRLKPHYTEAQHNLGTVCQELGDLSAAAAAYDAALGLDPRFARAHWNRALVWLAQGNLTQGWPAYEWRLQTARYPQGFPQPRWDGAALQGRNILVWPEQGVGDELLFASCVPDLLRRTEHVVLACDPRLVALLARSFPTATVRGTAQHDLSWLASAPPTEVYITMGSLPLYVRPGLDSFPRAPGYLRPDATRQAQYQQRLTALGPGLKVGLAWRSRKTRQEHPYYPPLAQWREVLTVPGVQFVNLQYDAAGEEINTVQQQWGVAIHAWDDLDVFHDLDGVAALMAGLDVIIAPETAVSALAGSLGRPVWRLTIAGGSWTMLGTTGCPWFPSMRVLCQQQYGHWDEVLTRVAHDLRRLASGT
jgi:Tfp pilus assembly protein PilF